MCVNYRGLNNSIIKDNFLLLLIENCLKFLDNRCCFSVLNFKSVFHQIGVKENSPIPDTTGITEYLEEKVILEYINFYCEKNLYKYFVLTGKK